MYKKKFIIVLLLLSVMLTAGLMVGCTPKNTDSEIELASLDGDDGTADSPDVEKTVAPDAQVSPLVSPPGTPLPPLTVVEGAAGVEGYIGYRDLSARGSMYVWFCPFTPNESGVDGIYILDTATHTRLEIGEDGWFQWDNILPGKYVLVTGADPETSHPVEDGDRRGHAKVYEFVAGEILEITVDGMRVSIPQE